MTDKYLKDKGNRNRVIHKHIPYNNARIYYFILHSLEGYLYGNFLSKTFKRIETAFDIINQI